MVEKTTPARAKPASASQSRALPITRKLRRKHNLLWVRQGRLLTAALVLALAAATLLGIGACGMGGHGGLNAAPVLPEFTPLDPDDGPNDPHYDEQWNMRFIEMPDAWGVLNASEIRRRSRLVYVAVLDTQIDMTHPDLKDNLLDGYDFVADRRIRAGSSVGGGTDHGTHVAGIIAAATNNGQGVAGIGWDRIRIIPVRVLDDFNSGLASDVANGILYAAGLPNSSGRTPARRADVINMSLGRADGEPIGSAVEDAVTQAADLGITLIASSGNGPASGPSAGEGRENGVVYPAAYPNVIAVGSVNPPPSVNGEKERSSYSDYGMGLEFVAPGGINKSEGVYSTLASAGYGPDAGTSMAAPHVSGLAALLYSVADSITQNGVRAVLRQTATTIAADESYPHPEFGYGLIHGGRALRRALMQPYGPYQLDEDEVVLQSLGVTTTAAPSQESGRLHTSERQPTTDREPAEPAPESYRPDRLILSLDADWVSKTPATDREARLQEIATEHGLASVSSARLRHALAHLSAGQKASELRRELAQEPEIAEVSFDFYVFAQ